MKKNTGPNYSGVYLLKVNGAALTEARIQSGLRLDDVVQRLGDGMNKSTVSRWEQGLLQPSPERLFALVKLFGTNDFIRLNEKVILEPEEIEFVRGLRGDLIQEIVRLNSKTVLTDAEIESVRKLREG